MFFYCINVFKASVYLRIHGKFVALWPFLGIVCETLLVIAITLVVRKKAANNSEFLFSYFVHSKT